MDKSTAQAAYMPAKSAQLGVAPATYTAPGTNEVTVKNVAIAINPLDWVKQDAGNFFGPWMKYPLIMGSDTAGEVVEVGTGVTRFKPGDRVVGHAVGMDERSNKSSEGAFQTFTVLRENLVSPIPDGLTYERACVMPLGLSTAACGLFMKDYMNLKLPKNPVQPKSETVLVWGGSTSVGCNAIQLARAAGYEVFTTASPQNHAYLEKLGAAQVFDYKSPTVVQDIVKAMKGKKSAGAFAIGVGSLGSCIDVLGSCEGKRFVAQASADLPPSGFPSSLPKMIPFGIHMGTSMAGLWIKSKQKGVSSKFIWGSDLMANELGNAIYKDFLPSALAEDRFVPAPEPMIVGTGLEHVQEAMRINKKGVSAKKVVVLL
jgi:NADPH:quinone reductase-like Zn-dependent oxidoreductase